MNARIGTPEPGELTPGQVILAEREARRERAQERAAAAAMRRIGRAKEEALPIAKAKLRKLSARDAAEFVKDLPHREKYVYAQAEYEDQSRTTVLRALRGYVPEPDEPNE